MTLEEWISWLEGGYVDAQSWPDWRDILCAHAICDDEDPAAGELQKGLVLQLRIVDCR